MKRRRDGFASLWVAIVLGVPAVVAAQEPASEPAPEPEVSIPLPEVAARSEQVASLLRDARWRLAAQPEIVAIEGALPEREERLAAEGEATGRRLSRGASLPEVQDLDRQWQDRESAIDTWRTILTDRASELEEALGELAALDKKWRETLARGRASGAPDATLRRIQTTLDDLTRAQDETRRRRAAVLTVQSRVSEARARVASLREDLAEAAARGRRELFEPDSPPLWALAAAASPADLGSGVTEALARDVSALREWAAARRARAALPVLFFLLTLAVAVRLRARIAARGADAPDLGPAARVLRRPVSTAVLLTLLALRLFDPLAPAVVTRALGLALLVPVLRLLPPLVTPAFRPLLYAIAVFYLIDRLRDLIEAVPVLERLVFTAETLAAAAVVAWLIHPSRLAGLRESASAPPRSLGIAARIGLALLVAALLANALGFVAFARLLGGGVLTSTFAAVVLYGGAQIARVVLAQGLDTRAGRALGIVRARGPEVRAWLDRGVAWTAFAVWALTTLELFALREPVANALAGVLSASFPVGTIDLTLGDALAFAVTITAAILLARSVRFVLQEDVFPRVHLARGVPYAIAASAQYAVLLLGFVLAIGAAGVDMTRFTLLAGAFGVGLGFGLQNVVNNFVSGLILLYERPVQVSDTVQVGTVFGEVKRIGIRSSTIRTWEGAEVIVPNGNLISDQVINWTLSDERRRADIPIGVAYGSDPQRVIDLLVGVARAHPEVMPFPEPYALFQGFGDSSLDFELRAWTQNFSSFLRIRSELRVGIHGALAEAGITIPFPQRDLHLKSVAPSVRERPPGGGD